MANKKETNLLFSIMHTNFVLLGAAFLVLFIACNAPSPNAKSTLDFDPIVKKQELFNLPRNRFEDVLSERVVIYELLLDMIRMKESIGHASMSAYDNSEDLFEDLTNASTIEQLLKLKDDENAVLACYASWALIEKDYDSIPELYAHFRQNDRKVDTRSGCIILESRLSTQFYQYYENQKADESPKTREILRQIDSIRIKYAPKSTGGFSWADYY